MNIKENLAWLALFLLAIVLIIAGFTGRVGALLACIFVPSQIVTNSGSTG